MIFRLILAVTWLTVATGLTLSREKVHRESQQDKAPGFVKFLNNKVHPRSHRNENQYQARKKVNRGRQDPNGKAALGGAPQPKYPVQVSSPFVISGYVLNIAATIMLYVLIWASVLAYEENTGKPIQNPFERDLAIYLDANPEVFRRYWTAMAVIYLLSLWVIFAPIRLTDGAFSQSNALNALTSITLLSGVITMGVRAVSDDPGIHYAAALITALSGTYKIFGYAEDMVISANFKPGLSEAYPGPLKTLSYVGAVWAGLSTIVTILVVLFFNLNRQVWITFEWILIFLLSTFWPFIGYPWATASSFLKPPTKSKRNWLARKAKMQQEEASKNQAEDEAGLSEDIASALRHFLKED